MDCIWALGSDPFARAMVGNNMHSLSRIAVGLAGFVAGYIVSGLAVLLLVYLYETLVQPSALLQGHVWWLTAVIGGLGAAGGSLLAMSLAREDG